MRTLQRGRCGVGKLLRGIGGSLLFTGQWSLKRLKNISLFPFILSLSLAVCLSLLLLYLAGVSWVGADLVTPSLALSYLIIPIRLYLLASKHMEKLDQWLTRAVQSLSLKRLIPSRGFLLKLGLRLLQLVLIVLASWVLFKLRI